jgi:hypothetical protein
MSARRVAGATIPVLLALAALAPGVAAARPTAPANLRITATTSASVTLAWDASRSTTGVAYYTVLELSTWRHFNVPASQTTFTPTRLWPNINHGWVVYAVDNRGSASPYSNRVTYRTPADTTAPSAAVLSTPYVGPTLVQLDWTDAVDDVTGVRYTLNVSGRAGQMASSSQAVVGRLAPSTSYTISVTATDNFGNASTSNTVTITTPPADNRSAPTTPGNFRGFMSGDCEAWLRWDASTDDVDPSAVIRYDFYVNGEFDTSIFGETRMVVYARTVGTNSFTIVAVDSSGNESAPSTIQIPRMQVC